MRKGNPDQNYFWIEILQKSCSLFWAIDMQYKRSLNEHIQNNFTAEQPAHRDRIVIGLRFLWFCSRSVQLRFSNVSWISLYSFNFLIEFIICHKILKIFSLFVNFYQLLRNLSIVSLYFISTNLSCQLNFISIFYVKVWKFYDILKHLLDIKNLFWNRVNYIHYGYLFI